MIAPSPALHTPEWLSVWSEVGELALQQPGEALEPGEIHARRERCSDRDRRDPEQPLADTHLIPWVAPRCERQRQGRPECRGPLLGKETCSSGPPCAVGVPNLIADRSVWLGRLGLGGNVRRLMYQSLIWSGILSDDPRCMLAGVDAEGGERLPDPLVDGVRRHPELGRNFL